MLHPENVGRFMLLPSEPMYQNTQAGVTKIDDVFRTVEFSTMSPKDMASNESMKLIEEAIYDIFGYFKINDGTNRATAYIKEQAFYKLTINPLAYLLSEQFTDLIGMKHGITIQFQPPIAVDRELLVQQVANSLITPNEARELLGLERSTETEMDDFYISSALMPLSGIEDSQMASEMQEPQQETEEPEEAEEEPEEAEEESEEETPEEEEEADGEDS